MKGGTAANAGHPTEYIQLNTKHPEKPSFCKYCGLRYQMVHHHGHEHGYSDGHGNGRDEHKYTESIDQHR